MKRFSTVLAASTAIFLPLVAHAQTAEKIASADAGIAADQNAEKSFGSSDIIVTATKRSERLQDVPVSLAVVSPEVLTNAGVVSTAQLGTLVPGLGFGDIGQPKLTQFVIRGVGTYALAVSLESSVGVTVDGVPIARADGALTDMVDVERVEVLKGPQGMLFGKNATAGLINIVSKKPVFGENSFIGHVSYGSYDEINSDVTVNLSNGDAGAARITAWRFKHDGFVHASKDSDGRDYYNKDSYGVRVSVAARPTEDLQLTLIGQYDGRDENGPQSTDRAYLPAVAGIPGSGANPIVLAHKTAIGIEPSEKNYTSDNFFPGYNRAENFAVTGLVDLELGGGFNLSSVTSFRSVKSRSSSDPFNSSSPVLQIQFLNLTDKYTQFTQELRVASDPSKRLSFVAGLFYYDFEITDKTSNILNGFPLPTSRAGFDAVVTNYMKNYAAFGEAQFRILPSLRLIAGLRQSHDRTGGSLVRTSLGPTVPPFLPSFGPFNPGFTAERETYDFTSYRFGAQFDVARDVMLYATMSRGYKAPGFNLTPQLTPGDLITDGEFNNALVDAETVKSYEIGFKSQFFDRRLTLNVTGFHSIFSNFQTTVTPPGSPSFLIQNAGELKTSGVEFEISARPIEGLSLGLNGAYIDARYTDFTDAQCYNGQPGGGPRPADSDDMETGLCYGRAFPVAAGTQSLNGVTLALSPKWSFNANARYDTPISDGWRGYISADYSYRSRTLHENVNDPRMVDKPYGITNFNLGFGPESGNWEISAYLRNAFKVHYVAKIREQLGFLQNVHTYNAQRRVGVQLEVKF